MVERLIWKSMRVPCQLQGLHAGAVWPRVRQLLNGAAVLAVMLPAFAVNAQTYRCQSSSGTYFSDRPCSPSTGSKIGGYGPLQPSTSAGYPSRVPPVARVEDHVKYLSAGCASISEAIRTGPNRGVRLDVIQGLREEYRRKCLVEDQEARTNARRDATAEEASMLAQRDADRNKREQTRVKADQCAGMRDVISTKRKRERELNATEVAALRSLESSYNDRCVSR